MKKIIKPNKKQLKLMKGAWEWLRLEQDEFYSKVQKIEERLSIVTGIPDLEFFMCDNEYVGIGNVGRTMKLIQWENL